MTHRLVTMKHRALGAALLLLGAVGAYEPIVSFARSRRQFHMTRTRFDTPPIEGLIDASFRADGMLIRGWYLPSHNRAGIVLVPGSEADRRQLLPEAMLLARHGYGALLIDMPGSGESEGQVSLGRTERTALSSALAWMANRPDLDRGHLGVLGFSMGAHVAAVESADDPLPKALVLEGIVFDIDQQTRYEFRKYWLLSQLPALLAKRFEGFHPGDLQPRQALSRFAPRPLLFIVGTADSSVSPRQTEEAFAAARMPKDLWVVPGAHHGDYLTVAPEAYSERVIRFFDRALLSP